ncbi:MAG: TraB/GumN family protein [Bacteroidota bacterium]
MTKSTTPNPRTGIQLAFTLLYCLSFQLLFSQSNTNNQKSLLWEIVGKNGQKPSYIYGTMHVSGKLAFNLNDSFFIGLKNCDFIALEIDPDLMLTDLVNSKLMKSALGAGVHSFKNKGGFYENSFALNEIKNRSLAGFLSQKIDLVNNLLYRSSAGNANKEEDTYLDLFIFQAGKKLHKKIIGLETFEGTMDMYAKSLKAESELDEKEKTIARYKEGVYTIEKLEEAYRKGDLVLIDSLSRNTSSKMSHKYMILERNKIMYHGIDSLMKLGASVFTGVGAAHLGGEEGVLNILRKNGYTVNPVSWQALKPSKLKAQIQKINFITELSKQYSTDSSFSVEAPNNMQSLQNINQDGIYLATDMINGSYYMVSSISHNGFINKHDKKYWSQKVDSLLYENIDGTITLKQESLTENGDICFLVNSKTRRGDIEKYKIIITPFKLFAFKVAGNGAYANSSTANQFLNSAKLYTTATVNKKEAGFTYQFTQNNISIYNGDDNNVGKHIAISNDGTKFNLLLVATNNETKYIEQDTFELNYIIQKAAEKYNCEIAYIHIDSNKTSALFEWKKNNETYKGKLVISGPHYYFLLDNSNDETFINSFKPNQKPFINNYQIHTDTGMLFSVKLVDVPEKNELATLIGNYQKKKVADAEYKTEFYSSKATGEVIRLTYNKLNLYKSYDNLDSLWNKNIKQATDFIMPTITQKVYTQKKGAGVLDFNVETKGNTHQYIRVKIIQKGRYIYILNTLCEKEKSSAFIDSFYHTFSLLDSNYGLSATESKVSLLLNNILHTDSTTKMDAREYVYDLTAIVKPSDFKAVKETIKKAEQSDLEMNKRIMIIECLKNIKTTECINWLKAYYTTVKDTPAYQFAVLYALAAQQTLPATLAFTELIKKETPIAEESSSFNSCFNAFNDSLELMAKVVPQLVFLLDYDEYKERTIELLAALKYKNLISTDLYAANKTKFLNSANIELKKQIASLQNTTENTSYNEYEEEDSYDYYNKESLTMDKKFKPFEGIVFDYAILLQPFYQEAAVKSFFDKAIKNGDASLQLSIGALLLKNNIAVDDNNWEKWVANNSLRANTYILLSNIGKLEKFPKSYKNLDSIARAQVYINEAKNSLKDSVTLVLKENINSKKGIGTLFVFKKRNNDNTSWKWSYIYLKDAGNFDIRELTMKTFMNEYEDLTDEKILDKIRLSIRLLDREKCEEVNFYNLASETTED